MANLMQRKVQLKKQLQYLTKDMSHPQERPILPMSEKVSRQERWFQTALEGELQAIEELPSDLNIRKPNNPFWQSLFRIAGIAKTGYISKDDALNKIKWACRHINLQGRDIEYQWNRAYQRATARYLNK